MSLKCSLEDYRVSPAAKVRLDRWPTKVKALYKNKKHYQELLAEYRDEIRELQSVLYAHDRYPLLLIFQGMDTAGKDGAIKHVMSGVNLEDYLHRNGTRMIKFFLHLSKEEQQRRFLERIDDPDKNWKLTRADIELRRQWNAFQAACADCLGATSTRNSPWHLIPADDKRSARLLISQAVVETMKTLRMKFPSPTKQHRKELEQVRGMLKSEGKS